eukprot:2518232-Rhodomonas_salina.1
MPDASHAEMQWRVVRPFKHRCAIADSCSGSSGISDRVQVPQLEEAVWNCCLPLIPAPNIITAVVKALRCPSLSTHANTPKTLTNLPVVLGSVRGGSPTNGISCRESSSGGRNGGRIFGCFKFGELQT